MIKNESWDEEWQYSERFMPEIIDLLHAEYLNLGWGETKIWTADYEEDVHHNTDLFIQTENGCVTRGQVRVRKPKYLYAVSEVTIRCFLALNGKLHAGETEFQKMMKGWGDLDCYCIAAPDNKHLASFFLGDTDKLREYARMEAQEFGVWETVHTKNDVGKVFCTWNPKRMKVASNTGCGFLVYKKEGPDAIPGFAIADHKFKDRWR